MISPIMTTTTVERRMASQAGTSACKNTGKASMAMALPTKRVESKRWCCLMIGKMELAFKK